MKVLPQFVNTDPKPCPAFSPGGEYCPWCGKHVGEYGWMRDHTPKPKPTPAAPTYAARCSALVGV